MNRAKMDPKRVVFAEADHLDVLKAAQIAYDEGIAQPILLGRKDVIEELMKEIDFHADDMAIIDSKSDTENKRRNLYAEAYWKLRRRKGVTLYDAQLLMRQRNYFAAMMVNEGDADAMLSGYSRAYPTALKQMLELFGRAKGWLCYKSDAAEHIHR